MFEHGRVGGGDYCAAYYTAFDTDGTSFLCNGTIPSHRCLQYIAIFVSGKDNQGMQDADMLVVPYLIPNFRIVFSIYSLASQLARQLFD